MADALGLLLASSLALAAAPAPAPDAEATLLAPGMALEREIVPPAVHLYEIEVQGGEYVEVSIQQRGVDVATTVTGPQGEPVLVTDSPGGESGPDPVAFVALASGLHRVALSAAPRPWPNARYELHVEAVRLPTANDLLRARALQAGAEGFRLLEEDGPGNAARILDLLREALAAWEVLGERYLQAWTENQIGYINGELLDRFDAQYDGFSRGLAIAREIHDDFSEAFFLMNVASAARRLGRLEEAEGNLERALALHRAAGRRAREAGTLTTLGGFLIAAGRPEEALDRLHEAVRLHHEVGHAPLEARTRLHVGDAYLALGEYELAIESYLRGLPGLAERRRYQALAHRQIGLARYRLGDLAEARSACDQALALYRTLDNRGEEATASLLLGQLMREDGQLSAARDVFAAAVPVLRAGGDRLGEAQAECELGETERRLGNQASARASLEAALRLIPDPGLPASVCPEQGLARLDRDLGDLASARYHAERALENVESLRASLTGQRWRASALAARQTVYDLLVEVRMRQHQAEPSAGHDVAAFETSERARARSLLELLAEGRVDVREGIAPELLAEERSLRQRLNAQAAAQEEALGAKRAARAQGLAREILELTARLVELEARIRSASPRYAALTRPQPLDLGAVRDQVLDGETQLLEYALGEADSWLWVASRDRLDSYRLAPRAEIERAARRVHELASAPGPGALATAAEELSRLVLAPAASALRARRLLVVAPGALQYVPFAALPLPAPSGKLLLSRFEVVTAPSASVLATLRGERGEPAADRKVVAVFADPVFDPSDPRVRPAAPAAAEAKAARPEILERALRGVTERGVLARLPFSRQEADAIVALAPREHTLEATGFAASRETATSAQLAKYRFVHFATHGVLNTRQPELSGVVLSLVDRAGRRQDGFLRLHDVYNLRLAADLVVLSGCQTGLGKDMAGEGLVGLTRGFMFAGAPRVVASLWPVDDLATSELMKRFYRGMLRDGLSPAAALRAAQLELSGMPRWSRPYFWAGFVLQGEWR